MAVDSEKKSEYTLRCTFSIWKEKASRYNTLTYHYTESINDSFHI